MEIIKIWKYFTKNFFQKDSVIRVLDLITTVAVDSYHCFCYLESSFMIFTGIFLRISKDTYRAMGPSSSFWIPFQDYRDIWKKLCFKHVLIVFGGFVVPRPPSSAWEQVRNGSSTSGWSRACSARVPGWFVHTSVLEKTVVGYFFSDVLWKLLQNLYICV